MDKPHNTAISISFNACADMSDSSNVNALFVQMAEYETSQKRSLHFMVKGDAAGTQVTFNLTSEFTKAHEAILTQNGVQRWRKEMTIEGYRQWARKSVIDFVKNMFS